jgi:predicted Zn-dependent protease with MMP-like domain
MNYKGEYIDRMAARVRELDSEIRELEELANKAVEEVKSEYREQINNLFLKKEELKDQVNRIQTAGGNAWEDMKAGTELSWEVFNDTVRKESKNK